MGAIIYILPSDFEPQSDDRWGAPPDLLQSMLLLPSPGRPPSALGETSCLKPQVCVSCPNRAGDGLVMGSPVEMTEQCVCQACWLPTRHPPQPAGAGCKVAASVL